MIHYKYSLLPLHRHFTNKCCMLRTLGISFEHQTQHNKSTAALCFTIVLFVNLFQNTQFYPYFPFKFLFFCNSYYSDFFPSQKSQLE